LTKQAAYCTKRQTSKHKEQKLALNKVLCYPRISKVWSISLSYQTGHIIEVKTVLRINRKQIIRTALYCRPIATMVHIHIAVTEGELWG